MTATENSSHILMQLQHALSSYMSSAHARAQRHRMMFILILNYSNIFTVARGISFKKSITVPEYKFFINVLQKTPVGKKKRKKEILSTELTENLQELSRN